ncbi:MAG: hypothetical protein M9904_13930 [Chitinophagaceae bacterium]|nr:hypothetical protein [Chitinophagaceae bacterium]
MPRAPKWVFDVAERLLPKLPLMEVANTEFLSHTDKKIRLKVGDKINNNRSGAFRYYDKSAEKFVIFGDETSLGLTRSFLPVLKKTNIGFNSILN